MVKVDHSACLALGGTFDPCYILTITAVPSHMGPTMNKRNAALIQSFMADILSVPPERGLLKFLSIPEENFATNGTTMLGEMERQEKQIRPDVARSMTAPSRKSVSSLSSMKRTNGVPPPPSVPTSSAPPKLDLDFNLTSTAGAESQPATATEPSATLRTVDEQKSTERPTTPVTSLHAPAGVFELPTVEVEPKRPSTSHSHTAKAMTGLRVSGTANDATGKSGRLPNGRPKTFSGEDFQSLTQSQAPQLPQLNIVSIPPQRRERLPEFMRNEGTPTSPTARQQLPSQMHDGANKSDGSKRDSYLDSLLGEPAQLTTIADLKQNTEPFIPIMLDKKEPAANTAKRRTSATTTATTATPKLPVAPAIPADDERPQSSQRWQSPKVGKRKSFLAAFRRSATVSKH